MNLKRILLDAVILAVLVLLFNQFRGKEVIVIPAKTNTKVIITPTPLKKFDSLPKIGGGFDVIEIPNPVNEELLRLYNEAKDSITQLNLYKDAITEREYEETLVDSVQTITVNTKVTGTLREQIISYRTNPITLERKPVRTRASLYLGGFGTLPQLPNEIPSVGANLQLQLNNKVFTIGYDTQERINVGVAFKIF